MNARKHNHPTRDIKPRGECPGCDDHHDNNRARDRAAYLVSLPVQPGQRWTHYKGGKYTIVAVALLESDPRITVVIYAANGITWSRPYSEFRGDVLIGASVEPRYRQGWRRGWNL